MRKASPQILHGVYSRGVMPPAIGGILLVKLGGGVLEYLLFCSSLHLRGDHVQCPAYGHPSVSARAQDHPPTAATHRYQNPWVRKPLI